MGDGRHTHTQKFQNLTAKTWKEGTKAPNGPKEQRQLIQHELFKRPVVVQPNRLALGKVFARNSLCLKGEKEPSIKNLWAQGAICQWSPALVSALESLCLCCLSPSDKRRPARGHHFCPGSWACAHGYCKSRVHAKGVVLCERACFCLLSAFYNIAPF